MDNSNIWDWDEGDARRVSSVYSESEAEAEAEQDEISIAKINMDLSEGMSENVAENAFILVDEPQNEPSYIQPDTQPDFQPVVPVKNIQQKQAEENQETNQSKSADYSSNYSQEDISENKPAAMAAYLLGPIGIIIALLAARDSAYTAFHVRQALKLTISSVVLEITAAIFALLGLMPFVGIIFQLVLVIIGIAWLAVLVLRLTAAAQVGDGEAREPAFIGRLSFFK